MKKIKSIIIANDAEAFNVIIGRIKDECFRAKKVNKEHFLSGRFLFWENDDKIVITPFNIEDAILKQLPILGYKNTRCWTPVGKGINLCDEIQKDITLFNSLKDVIRKNPGVVLSAYCCTKEFIRLISVLRSEELIFKVDQEPKEGAQWLVEYLGSKIGFRIEAEKIGIASPEFFICKNIQEVIETGKWFFKKNMSFVVKAALGEGGWGVLIIENKKYQSKYDVESKLMDEFTNDSIWEVGPFVIEEFIESSHTENKSPSVEICVNADKIKITYLCNQLIDETGKFIGISMGNGCVTKKIQSKIYVIARKIGQRYKHLGYRGFFDIDFIVSRKGVLYPVETNVRRTGGTHVYDLARNVFGKEWSMLTSCLSNDTFTYKGDIMKASEIIEKIKTITFPTDQNKTKEGVIIVAVSKDIPVFSFVIFAKTKIKTMRMYEKLIATFQ